MLQKKFNVRTLDCLTSVDISEHVTWSSKDSLFAKILLCTHFQTSNVNLDLHRMQVVMTYECPIWSSMLVADARLRLERRNVSCLR